MDDDNESRAVRIGAADATLAAVTWLDAFLPEERWLLCFSAPTITSSLGDESKVAPPERGLFRRCCRIGCCRAELSISNMLSCQQSVNQGLCCEFTEMRGTVAQGRYTAYAWCLLAARLFFVCASLL